MAKAPSDAEFLKWLTPGAALKRLPADWPERTKRDAIMTRFSDGSLCALARTLSAQTRGEATKHDRMLAIDPALWHDPWRCRDRTFWTTGDMRFDDEPPMQVLFTGLGDPVDDSAKRILTFKDVRFEPGSFEREFAGHLQPQSRQESARRTDAPSAAEFAGWLTPRAALAAVPDDVDDRQRSDWITRRLREGQIVAVAEKMTLTDMNGLQEASYTIIKRHFWSWRELGDWFASGDLDVTDAPETISAGPRLSLTAWRYDPEKIEVTRYSAAMFLGVRLDPTGFPAKPEPTTIYLPPSPSPEEFEQWWLPCNAIDSFLSLGDDQALEAVRSLLTAGVIRAAAEKLILGDKVLGLSGIPKEVWPMVRDEGFWSTDFLKIQFGKSSLTAWGVKLDPDAILEHAPPRPERPPLPPHDITDLIEATGRADLGAPKSGPEPEPDHRDKPRLPDSWLQQWHALFILAYPDGSIELARQSVAGMFPGHHVSRDRVRALFPSRAPGRPRKNKDNS